MVCSVSTSSLATRVRQARLEAGLTQAQLAGSEISPNTIHRIEAGRVRPSRRVLSYIARRVGKPLRYFLDDATPEEAEIDYALLRGFICRACGALSEAIRWFARAEQTAAAAADVSRRALARVCLAGTVAREGWTAAREAEVRAAQARALRFGHGRAVAESEYDIALGMTAQGMADQGHRVLAELMASPAGLTLHLRVRCLVALSRCAASVGEDPTRWYAQLETVLETLDLRRQASGWETRAAESEAEGDWQKAVQAAEQSLGIWKTVELKQHEAVARYHVGHAYETQGNADGALRELARARAAAREVGDVILEAQVLVSVGQVYTALGRTREAIETVQEIHAMFATLGDSGSASAAAPWVVSENVPPIAARSRSEQAV
ncbi:MAG TPA: helix-turn-helix transcriptional regulator [bacterium]|nr:helix-turn-helix transcriptional regulator [bacterium]